MLYQVRGRAAHSSTSVTVASARISSLTRALSMTPKRTAIARHFATEKGRIRGESFHLGMIEAQEVPDLASNGLVELVGREFVVLRLGTIQPILKFTVQQNQRPGDEPGLEIQVTGGIEPNDQSVQSERAHKGTIGIKNDRILSAAVAGSHNRVVILNRFHIAARTSPLMVPA